MSDMVTNEESKCEFDDKDPRYLHCIDGITDPETLANIKEICHKFQILEAKECHYEAFKNVMKVLSK